MAFAAGQQARLLGGQKSPGRQSLRRQKTRFTARCVLARPTQYSELSYNPKVALFVEPSPFSHVSGMKIRFSNLIKELRQLGSEVTVFTPCVDPPRSYCGAKVCVPPCRPRQPSTQFDYSKGLDLLLSLPFSTYCSVEQQLPCSRPEYNGTPGCAASPIIPAT